MPTAKVFKSGNSQAIRLPKEFRLKVTEVELIRQGDDILRRQPHLVSELGLRDSAEVFPEVRTRPGAGRRVDAVDDFDQANRPR